MKIFKITEIQILFFVVSVLSAFHTNIAQADEWKYCDVYSSMASEREAANAFGKIKTKISYLKKQDHVSISIFLDGKTFTTADLIPTGKRFYGNGKPFLGYADKTNTLILQEFENDNNIILTLNGEVDFTMFAKCN
jgi:hypothetical protein